MYSTEPSEIKKAKVDYYIKDLDKKKIRERLKNFFANKKEVRSVSSEDKDDKKGAIYKHCFYYKDDIEQFQDVPIRTEIIISDNDDTLASITVYVAHENINEYDLRNYCNKIYFYFSQFWIDTDSARKEFKQYIVRVYQKFMHDIGFKGKYKVKFLSDYITFKPLFDTKSKDCPIEHIIAFDCPVKALNLNDARSQAINRVKQFVACLAPLIGIGFSDIHYQYMNVIRKVERENQQGLETRLQPLAFIDLDFGQENALIVKDNMNGLQHVQDMSSSVPNYFSTSFVGTNDKIINNLVINTRTGLGHLEELFINRKIDDKIVNSEDVYCDQLCAEVSVNSPIKIPRKIRGYCKKISEWSENNPEIYQHFLGSCTLYNMSYVYGFYEPTLMIAMMVASLEALLKIDIRQDKINFQSFLRKYLGEAYDKALCDFLYGSLRSGFFHSGATYFLEYNCTLDVSLQGSFFSRKEILMRANKLLRKAYISWIEQNMLKSEDEKA